MQDEGTLYKRGVYRALLCLCTGDFEICPAPLFSRSSTTSGGLPIWSWTEKKGEPPKSYHREVAAGWFVGLKDTECYLHSIGQLQGKRP